MINATPPLAVYVHWPFCKAKCPYCDFNSHVRAGVDAARWERALLAELAWMAARLPPHAVSSIFFGGGTPSLMPPATVAAVIERIRALFPAVREPEITLEANPTSVEAARFRDVRAAGVARVSLGVQSLRADGLRFLGREHSAAEALAAVALAAEIFPRYSFDMIYARPEQTPHMWQAELREALPWMRGHASLYQLTIEEETPFSRLHAAGGFTLPPEQDAARMYEETAETLRAAGLETYEISNYAAPGQECFHNVEIWRGRPYLGIGPGAHGRLPLPCDAAGKALLPQGRSWVATRTLKSPERWLAQVEASGHGLEETTVITEPEQCEERVLMGLRLSEGIDLATLPCPARAATFRAVIDRQGWQEQGIMEINGTRASLTPQGRLLLDSVTRILLTA